MAIVSKFYTGSVNQVEWSKGGPQVGSLYYGVEGSPDFAPSKVVGVDRTVRLAAGTAWGRGVRDVSDAPIDVPLPAATGAVGTVRWDLIVVRRAWSTSTSSVVRVEGTANRRIPANRLVGPGAVDDQPIALAKVTSGSSEITELVDLRCFGGGVGGLQVLDKLALDYLEFPGAMVYCGTEVFVFPALGDDWVKIHNFSGIQLFGASNPLSGSLASRINEKAPFLLQAGTDTNTADGGGYARITFPVAFPNGLLTVLGFNGDDWVSGGAMQFASSGMTNLHSSAAYGDRASWVYAAFVQDANSKTVGRAPAAGRKHRINWIAIGF